MGNIKIICVYKYGRRNSHLYKLKKEKMKNLSEKVLQYLAKIGPAKRLIKDVKFLLTSIKEHPVKFGAIATGALIYFLSPVDAVPDVIPIVGFLDDAAVLAGAVAGIKKML